MKHLQLCILLILASNFCKGQFSSASVSHVTACSTSVASTCTGTDILRLNSHTYAVCTWSDGSNAGWSWSFDGSAYTTQAFSYSTNVQASDIALTTDGSDAYAAMVYFDLSSGTDYYFEVWKITTSPSTSNYDGGLLSPVSAAFGTTLHIDGIKENYWGFAATYDNSFQLAFGIGYKAGNPPELGKPCTFPSIPTLLSPDVAVRDDHGSTIFFTGINQSGEIEVYNTNLPDIINYTSLGLNPTFTSDPPTYTHFFPRIGCPRGTIYPSGDDWTVVAADNDGSSDYLIVGWTSIAGSVSTTPLVYNDSSQLPFYYLNPVANEEPVVTYDSIGNIKIGWTFDNSGGYTGATVDAKFPVVVKCNASGAIGGGGTYLETPSSLSASDDYSRLSLAGRNATLNIYTYFNNNNGLVKSKNVSPNAATLRERSESNLEFPFWCTVHDITGRQMARSFVLSTQDVDELIHSLGLNNGLYLVNLGHEVRKILIYK